MMVACFSESLFEVELEQLVKDNSKKSHKDLAIFLRDKLTTNYPSQYWAVTVYDDITGYDKHAFVGVRIGYNFRYYGINYVVTRYPRNPARVLDVPISEVVGSISKNDAKEVRDSIKSDFDTRGLTFASIHVVKRKTGTKGWWHGKHSVGPELTTAQTIPKKNFFWKEFADVIVIVVAPR